MDERGCFVAVTAIGLVAAAITIFVFLTGKASIKEVFVPVPEVPGTQRLPPEVALRFQKGPGGTVLDTQTGLTWQTMDNGFIVNNSNAKAICSDLVIGQEKEWTLPSVNELRSLSSSLNLTRLPDVFSLSVPILWTRDSNTSRGPIYVYYANGPAADPHWEGAVALCVHH